MSSPRQVPNDLKARAHFERCCAGKDQYPTRAAAEAGIEDIRRHKGRDVPKPHLLNAYKCDYCKEFHIGHAIGGDQ